MKPNLVLLHSHDTGRHLEPYGAPVPTPNLMRMADEGVLFRRAFCASPGCAPSRASLMTGMMPHENGMMGLCHRGFRLNNPKQHMASRLREVGYHTALIGFQHETSSGEKGLGYDEVQRCTELPRDSRQRAARAAAWLESAPRQPFFLSIGLLDTHRPFPAPEPPDDPRRVAPLPWLPDAPEVREDVASLHTSVRRVDEALGLVMAAIDRAGLRESTLLVYTTDHGVAFPRAKATLFDAGIGVAWLMRGPGGMVGGRVVEPLVSQVDFLPTFFALVGLPPPSGARGVDLLPLLRGDVVEARDAVHAEITYHAAYDPARCIRTARYKLIRHFEDYPRMVLPNVDNGPVKRVLTDAGLPLLPRARTMLFDLLADPQEFENVADAPEYADVRAGLEARLREEMQRSNDPLLDGPVLLPPGAWATPPDAYDPEGGPG